MASKGGNFIGNGSEKNIINEPKKDRRKLTNITPPKKKRK